MLFLTSCSATSSDSSIVCLCSNNIQNNTAEVSSEYPHNSSFELTANSSDIFSSDIQSSNNELSTNEDYSLDEDIQNEKCFTVATWNIGHFSNGSYPYSTLNGSDSNVSLYKDTIEALSADIVSINEYSDLLFCDNNDILTKNTVFDSYEYKYEFLQNGYCCNALFSIYTIQNLGQHFFESNQGVTTSSGLLASDYYFVAGFVHLFNYEIAVASIHCAFNTNSSKLSVEQYCEIISFFSSFEYVILMGDFNNVCSFDDVFCFEQYGYLLANSRTNAMDTYHFNNVKNRKLDNIIVKGFDIVSVDIFETSLSDHDGLVCDLQIK